MHTKTDAARAPEIEQVVRELREGAIESGDIPAEVVARAASATRRALAGAEFGVRRRAEAYFAACVARGLARHRGPSRAADRLLIASVVDDLSASGRDGHAIWDALRRGWEGRVSTDVLDEFRERLCA